jgi:hypothetical protein
MTSSKREIAEGLQYQGEDEEITYSLTVTNWISTLSAATSVKVYDITENARTDVTTTVMPTATMTVNGNVIIFSPLKALTADHTYRLDVKFSGDGQKPEAFAIIQAEH